MFSPRVPDEGWFRIGKVTFTSTLVLVALGAIGLVLTAFVPPLANALALFPDAVLTGQVWRLVTWPIINAPSIWTGLTLLMLWYFGTMLEAELGRRRMAWLYVGSVLSIAVAAILVGLLLPGSTAVAGLNQVQFAVLLLWIAEYPTRRFIFNIPAWGFGLFIVVLQLLSYIGARAWGPLLSVVLGMLGIALFARGLGLLSQYSWIPGGPSQRGHSKATHPAGSGRGKSKKTKPDRTERRKASDEERLDDLLAKISAEGLHSLTKSERNELQKIRERRRK